MNYLCKYARKYEISIANINSKNLTNVCCDFGVTNGTFKAAKIMQRLLLYVVFVIKIFEDFVTWYVVDRYK